MAGPRIEAQQMIDAPLDDVWRAMIQLDQYSDWNPFVVRVEGPAVAQLGAGLLLHVRWYNRGGATARVRVCTLDGPADGDDGVRRARMAYAFEGPLHALHFVRSTRVQTLEQPRGGPTVYKTWEQFGGLMTAFLPVRRIRRGFEDHGAALARRVAAA